MINPFHESDTQSHFRLIPEIDKMRTVVNLATTRFGKLILSVLFALIFFIPGKFDLYLFAGIIFLGVSKVRKPLKLLIFCFWVPISHHYMDLPRSWGLLPRHDFIFGFRLLSSFRLINPEILGQLICRALVLLLVLGVFEASRRSKKLNGLVLPFAIWGVLVVLAMAASPGSLGHVFSWNLEAYFGTAIFALLYAQISKDPPTQKRTEITDLSMGLQILSVGGLLPMVRQQKDLAESDQQNLAVCQLKAVKLLVWSVFLDFIREGLEHFFFSAPTRYPGLLNNLPGLAWPNYAAVGIGNFLNYHLPLWKIWSILIAELFLYILEIAAFTGFSIALLRLVGIYTPRGVFRPYLARTFNGYFRRILFFYSEILIHFFFFPAWKFLRAYISNKKICMIVALFYAVFLGGLIFHVTKEMVYFRYFDHASASSYFLSHVPYFFMVATITCVSAWGVVPRLLPFQIPRVLGLGCILIVHSVLMTLTCVNPDTTFEQHLRFFLALFSGT